MSATKPSLTQTDLKVVTSRAWIGPLLGLLTGTLGGLLQSKVLEASLGRCLLLGSIFGLAFSFFLAKRATTPGAGLIWGLASALFLWFLVPAGIDLLRMGPASSSSMLTDAQERFPQLVAYLVCLGMPVGVVLGIVGSFRARTG